MNQIKETTPKLFNMFIEYDINIFGVAFRSFKRNFPISLILLKVKQFQELTIALVNNGLQMEEIQSDQLNFFKQLKKWSSLYQSSNLLISDAETLYFVSAFSINCFMVISFLAFAQVIHDYDYSFEETDQLSKPLTRVYIFSEFFAGFYCCLSQILEQKYSLIIFIFFSLFKICFNLKRKKYYSHFFSLVHIQLSCFQFLLIISVLLNSLNSFDLLVLIIIPKSAKLGKGIKKKVEENIHTMGFCRDDLSHLSPQQFEIFIRQACQNLNQFYEDYMEHKQGVFFESLYISHISQCSKSNSQKFCFCSRFSMNNQTDCTQEINLEGILGQQFRQQFILNYISNLKRNYLHQSLYDIHPNDQALNSLSQIFQLTLDFYSSYPKKLQNINQSYLNSIIRIQDIFSPYSCSLYCSLVNKTIEIKRTSSNFSLIFETQQIAIVGKQVSNLLPKTLFDAHELKMDEFLNFGNTDSTISQREIFVFAINGKGYVFPINIRIKMESFSDDFGVITLIKKVNDTQQYILFNDQFQITEISYTICQKVFSQEYSLEIEKFSEEKSVYEKRQSLNLLSKCINIDFQLDDILMRETQENDQQSKLLSKRQDNLLLKLLQSNEKCRQKKLRIFYQLQGDSRIDLESQFQQNIQDFQSNTNFGVDEEATNFRRKQSQDNYFLSNSASKKSQSEQQSEIQSSRFEITSNQNIQSSRILNHHTSSNLISCFQNDAQPLDKSSDYFSFKQKNNQKSSQFQKEFLIKQSNTKTNSDRPNQEFTPIMFSICNYYYSNYADKSSGSPESIIQNHKSM
ncbi:hypothetical protein ABPG72_021767 [Tetrahymena utriculariae]